MNQSHSNYHIAKFKNGYRAVYVHKKDGKIVSLEHPCFEGSAPSDIWEALELICDDCVRYEAVIDLSDIDDPFRYYGKVFTFPAPRDLKPSKDHHAV
jgi:hypothetical protein